MSDFNLKFKIWLETNGDLGVLGEGKCRLLKTINKTGSLIEATKKLGYTYRKTWDSLNKIEKNLGFNLITRQRGGKTGGKTSLTPEGKIIIEIFDEFHEKYDKLIADALNETAQKLKERMQQIK